MATITTYAFADARRTLPDCRPAPVCDPRPVCPACGGLECLCRPRFFAGQLLTEEDLNRLDHYIVAKNRLHNRHLFGSGVVCGLEVICSSCDPAGSGNVVVRPGYALSPCGNDIVVCKDAVVNVCDLINKCRPRLPDECLQPGADPARCAGDEDWVLAVCYQERPSRGVTALRGASCSCDPGAGCGCGGSGGGGDCGCDGAARTNSAVSQASCGCSGGTATKSAKMQPAARPGAVAPQCEPTQVCEGYSFAVYRKPPKTGKEKDHGALVNRFICCAEPMIAQLTAYPTGNPTQSELHAWFSDLVAMMRDFLVTEGLYDCELAARLGKIVAPARDTPLAAYVPQWTTSVIALFAVMASVFQKCLCAALLPPCPPPELNDCIPIATVNVARDACRVQHVCNLGERRFAITFPTLGYWFSWLPVFTSGLNPKEPTLREALERLCCVPLRERFDFDDVELNMRAQARRRGGAPDVAAGAPRPDMSVHPLGRLLVESLSGAGGSPNAASLLLGAIGARTKNGSPLVSPTALEHPAQAMLMEGLVAPLVGPLLRGLSAAPAAADAGHVNELAAKVSRLEATVERQQAAMERQQGIINELLNR